MDPDRLVEALEPFVGAASERHLLAQAQVVHGAGHQDRIGLGSAAEAGGQLRACSAEDPATRFIEPIREVVDPSLVLDGDILVVGVENCLRSSSIDIVAIHEKRYRPVPFPGSIAWHWRPSKV